MKVKNLIALLMTTLILSTGIGTAFSQEEKLGKEMNIHPPDGSSKTPFFFLEGKRLLNDKKVQEQLKLSKEQKETIQDISIDTQKETIQLKADIKIKQLELGEEIKKEKPDKEKIEKLSEELFDLMEKNFKTNILSIIEIKSILSPQQLEQFEKIVQENREKRVKEFLEKIPPQDKKNK